ncbi:MAG TPA: Leg1-related protein [Candidatus Elarobacter sp.]|nr:Leg1-related protein [Candidatus Elarobacter sp.]
MPDLSTAASIPARSVVHRLAMYRLLMERTGARELVGRFGEHHIFWGYAEQLYWQWRSGRLGNDGRDDEIGPDAWWGRMNFTLSVVPLAAAMKAGYLPWLPVLEGVDEVRADFVKPLRMWADFFDSLASGDSLQRPRRLGWAAHLASVEAGVERFGAQFRLLSRMEQRFARGWTQLVMLFGEIQAPTEFEATRQCGAGMLPPRMLRERDEAGDIGDMSAETNAVVRSIVQLGEESGMRLACRAWLWRHRRSAARADEFVAQLRRALSAPMRPAATLSEP